MQSWMTYIGKSLFFAAVSALLVFAAGLLPVSGTNQKAVGVTILLRERGGLLVLSGLLQMVFGLVLFRANVIMHR